MSITLGNLKYNLIEPSELINDITIRQLQSWFPTVDGKVLRYERHDKIVQNNFNKRVCVRIYGQYPEVKNNENEI